MNNKRDHFYGIIPRDQIQWLRSCLPKWLCSQVKGLPSNLHPNADTFFRDVIKKRPDLLSVVLLQEKGRLHIHSGHRDRDLRELLNLQNLAGCGVYFCFNYHSQYPHCFQSSFVSVSRRYTRENFLDTRDLLERIGLPTPTVIRTFGDGLVRFSYLLDYAEEASREWSVASIQKALDIAFGIADLDPEPLGRFAVPGFKCPDSSASVRMVGGSLLPVDSSVLISSILQMHGNLSGLVFAGSKDVPESLMSVEDVIRSSTRVIQYVNSFCPWTRELFLISCWSVIIRIGEGFVHPDIVASSLGLQEQAGSWYLDGGTKVSVHSSTFFLNLLLHFSEHSPPVDIFEESDDETVDIECFVNDETILAEPQDHQEQIASISSSLDVSRVVEQGKNDAAALRQFARILASDSDASPIDLPQFLKSFSRRLQTKFDGSYLESILKESVLYANGVKEPLTPDDTLTIREVPWLWESIFLEGSLNLVIAQPKVGKTSFVISFLASLLRGDSQSLGFRLSPIQTPRILIIGTDQPESDWIRMLADAGLLTEEQRLNPAIVALFTAANSLYLDGHGLDVIDQYAREHKGLILVIDSLAACTSPLGIDENSQAIALPIMQLMNRVAAHDVTTILIHHSGKSSASDSPTAVSRGSSAIPATASQIISLSREEKSGDQSSNARVWLKTAGRAGTPIQIAIQRAAEGWVSHGDLARVSKKDQRNDLLKSLTERQKMVLKFIQERWRHDELTTPNDVIDLRSELFLNEDPKRSVREVFLQLADKRLIERTGARGSAWRPVPFG